MTPATATFLVTVNYDKSIGELLTAGRYDFVDDEITNQRFAQAREGQEEIEIELVHFDLEIPTRTALKWLAKKNLRLVTAVELLAFGVAYPDEQRKFPVIAPSPWCDMFGARLVPCLSSNDDLKRGVYVNHIGVDEDEDWNESCRFAAVRMVRK